MYFCSMHSSAKQKAILGLHYTNEHAKDLVVEMQHHKQSISENALLYDYALIMTWNNVI